MTTMSNNPYHHQPTGDLKHRNPHLYLDVDDEPPNERNTRGLSPNPFGTEDIELQRTGSPILGPPTPSRRSSESSAPRSAYSGVEPVTQESGVPLKELGVYHTKWHTCLLIQDSANHPLYYINNSTFTPKRPDVAIHAGADDTGPVLGVAQYPNFSSDMKVGVGDPSLNNGANVTWEDIKKTSKIVHNRYDWSMTLPSTQERHSFIWKRTTHFGMEGEHVTAKWSYLNFKLVEAGKGDVVLANFASNGLKKWRKMGKFVLRAELGEEWEFMILLTGLAIIEKARRRERARRGASATAASGGGG
jgi:hypothetical protein